MTQQEQPSSRVLRRLLALCRAEGIQVFHDDPGPGIPLVATYPENEPSHEQALCLAIDIGTNLARGGWTWNTLDPLTINAGESRSDAFTSALLANLYAAEALALD